MSTNLWHYFFLVTPWIVGSFSELIYGFKAKLNFLKLVKSYIKKLSRVRNDKKEFFSLFFSFLLLENRCVWQIIFCAKVLSYLSFQCILLPRSQRILFFCHFKKHFSYDNNHYNNVRYCWIYYKIFLKQCSNTCLMSGQKLLPLCFCSLWHR